MGKGDMGSYGDYTEMTVSREMTLFVTVEKWTH